MTMMTTIMMMTTTITIAAIYGDHDYNDDGENDRNMKIWQIIITYLTSVQTLYI